MNFNDFASNRVAAAQNMVNIPAVLVVIEVRRTSSQAKHFSIAPD